MNIVQCNQLQEVKVIYKTGIPINERPQISGSQSAYEQLKNLYNPDEIEHTESFFLLILNRANRVLGWKKISHGGISGTVVDIRVIMQIAIKSNASCLIVCHNHPSGQLHPSEQDKQITSKLIAAAKLFDISVLDHLIITHSGYFSFSDEGIMR